MYIMNQKKKYIGLLTILLVLVIVSVVANSLQYASAAGIDEKYAHDDAIKSLYKDSDKHCGSKLFRNDHCTLG